MFLEAAVTSIGTARTGEMCVSASPNRLWTLLCRRPSLQAPRRAARAPQHANTPPLACKLPSLHAPTRGCLRTPTPHTPYDCKGHQQGTWAALCNTKPGNPCNCRVGNPRPARPRETGNAVAWSYCNTDRHNSGASAPLPHKSGREPSRFEAAEWGRVRSATVLKAAQGGGGAECVSPGKARAEQHGAQGGMDHFMLCDHFFFAIWLVLSGQQLLSCALKW